MVVSEDHCSTVEMGWDQEVVDEEGLTGKIAEDKVVPPGCSLTMVAEAEEVAVGGTVAAEEVAGKVVDGSEEVEVDKEDCSLEAAGTDHRAGRNKTPVGEETGWESETVGMKVPGDCAAREAVG